MEGGAPARAVYSPAACSAAGTAREIATFWIAIGAALLSLASAGYTRREARAAEGALSLERQREVERGRPDVDVHFEKWIQVPLTAELTIENRSAGVIDRAVVVILTLGPTQAGFTEDQERLRRDYTFRELAVGVPQRATFMTVDMDSLDDPKVKFLVTFQNGTDEWTKQYEVDLPASPMIA